MQLHDPTVDATTRHRATTPKNESQKINIASSCNNTPRRSAPQRSARCPVIGPCLDFALASGQASGVWGGTGEDERDRLLRTTRNDARRRSAL
ncbi:WhiB family transcriptional regulator [Streptomyces sp. AK010]|uniref:WhiB family transcriptional regulator n=1 Tax=Streptomyces sp. AK010 TaxID=2723074 RepID=UPI0016162A8C|nr:WhiB family transcriptional regulator [Streptomyces sp. AK010]